MRSITLEPIPATIESFAPYGVLPPDEGDGNPTADLEFLLNDGWVNYIGHSLDEIDVRDGRLCCELLNRHDTHTQTLTPLDADAVVVVAPPAADFSEPAHFDAVRAFALPRLTCVHLHRGPGTGAPIRSLPSTCGWSTSRAGATGTTTASCGWPGTTGSSSR